MDKFKEVFEKYCLKELLFIFAISAFLFFLFYGKQDVYLVDVGREAYIPWQMLKGQLLYKDIFNVYGALGYQINAILYYIFGVHLNTLYFAGFLNSLIILYSVFFISKLFVDKKIAITTTGIVLFCCVFCKSIFNFIFTYSYCAVYALSGFLLSLYFSLRFIRDKKNYAFILAFLFAGFSFACKIENAPYFCFLFACLPFVVKKDWKKYLYALTAFFAFPVLSFGTLLIQGVSINDLTHAVVLIKKLVEAKATTYFYYNYGIYPNQILFGVLLKYIKIFTLFVIPPFIFLFLANFIKIKYINRKIVKILINIFVFIMAILFINNNLDTLKVNYTNIFCWIGLADLLILFGVSIFWGIRYIKQKINLSNCDLMFLFLLLSVLCVSLKGLLATVLTCYGSFTITAMVIPFVVFLTLYVPVKIPQQIKSAFVNTILILSIMIMAGCFLYNLERISADNIYTVKNQNGLITINDVYPYQNELLKYIEHNVPVDSKIVIFPEGAIINFLAQRDTNNKYYYLIPGNVEVFGEENILNDFKQNPPDYFIGNNLAYSCYGVRDFCSYASKICDFIDKNYTVELKLDGDIIMTLYKHK